MDSADAATSLSVLVTMVAVGHNCLNQGMPTWQTNVPGLQSGNRFSVIGGFEGRRIDPSEDSRSPCYATRRRGLSTILPLTSLRAQTYNKGCGGFRGIVGT
ncbi:hypothetical protein K458DRAFT_420332 [Lentithecium fluviatile CBS 122367]|uniref:Uncharacterized protein n=1 Tax=Lentithecium fluviatile CBS 122367 TaxID=1168545 RepID=A0A6G1IUQ1_9PLEO|nr:hypothetical protein K458DRAFT_420332 [Lentithecium fluviatile CBS 122367]